MRSLLAGAITLMTIHCAAAIEADGVSAVETVNAAAIEGSWRGELRVRTAVLPLVLNFSQQDGVTTCTMDSPSQNAYGLPATVEHLSADSIAITSGGIGVRFSGQLAGDEISGVFSQMGHRFDLTLQREPPLSVRRPQTPRPPFPYQTRDTMFASADGTLLAGTFALPEGFERGKTPMCVLVTGSGPQNRDEELFEHRPFAVIADYLARNGVATFRYDDRGTAESGGDFAAATVSTFCDDAKAALRMAKSFGEDPTGLIGHSEGGTVALLLAAEGEPDFVVSLAGMAVSGKETILAQNRCQLEISGFDEEVTANSMALLSAIFDAIIDQYTTGSPISVDPDSIAASLGAAVPAPLMQSIKTNMNQANTYFASCLSTDPRKGMAGITCPVLALNGTLDTQVAADENLAAISAGIPGASVVKFPGLNHLFQHAATGDLSEYAEIPETISPEVLARILTFVKSLK